MGGRGGRGGGVREGKGREVGGGARGVAGMVQYLR